jgi:hypothetical protein
MGLLARAFTLVVGLGSLLITAGLARTLQTQRGPKQDEFRAGRVPAEPDGFYEGSADFDTRGWKGKTYKQAEHRGINIFDGDGSRREQFPFRTYVGPGLRDREIEVLKIDYDIPENPRWLRSILDEVVEVGEGKLLGKIHARLVPGLPFSLGYFQLERARVTAPPPEGAAADAVPHQA